MGVSGSLGASGSLSGRKMDPVEAQDLKNESARDWQSARDASASRSYQATKKEHQRVLDAMKVVRDLRRTTAAVAAQAKAVEEALDSGSKLLPPQTPMERRAQDLASRLQEQVLASMEKSVASAVAVTVEAGTRDLFAAVAARTGRPVKGTYQAARLEHQEMSTARETFGTARGTVNDLKSRALAIDKLLKASEARVPPTRLAAGMAMQLEDTVCADFCADLEKKIASKVAETFEATWSI